MSLAEKIGLTIVCVLVFAFLAAVFEAQGQTRALDLVCKELGWEGAYSPYPFAKVRCKREFYGYPPQRFKVDATKEQQ